MPVRPENGAKVTAMAALPESEHLMISRRKLLAHAAHLYIMINLSEHNFSTCNPAAHSDFLNMAAAHQHVFPPTPSQHPSTIARGCHPR